MKIKILGITSLVSIALMAGFAGCVSYAHSQDVKNGTGNGIRRIYVRDTGTTAWVLPPNNLLSDKEISGVTGAEEFPAFWIYNNSSSTPPDTPNQDIQIIDNNGRIYTKLNVPIVYNTDIIKIGSGTPRINRSDAIVFTDKDRHPVLVMQNQTGFPIRITAPVTQAQAVNNGAAANWSLPELGDNRNITVNYSVNDFTFTKNVQLNADVTTLPLTEKPPTVTVTNNTGYPATVSKPFNNVIPNGDSYVYLKPSRTANLVQVTYSIRGVGRNYDYDEQVTVNNADVTLTLTKRPATLTILNNVGATINFIWLRIPGSPSWEGGNIVIRSGTVYLGSGTAAQTGDISGSIVNKDSMKLWLGNVNLTGNIFDIRITDVQGNEYVKSNVQTTSDMTLTFTQSDKR